MGETNMGLEDHIPPNFSHGKQAGTCCDVICLFCPLNSLPMAVPLTTVTLIVFYNGFGHRVSGGRRGADY
jgi:hypothetical protein